MLLFLVVVLSFLCVPSAAQESGWADSAGYKQQILKTGAIKQISYSPDGATLYSVSADSLWHIHHWDAETGKLLRTQTIDKTPYKPVFSVTISTDALTYSVCAGVLSDNAYHARIFSLKTDSLLHDVVVNIKDVQECSAVFDSTLQFMWLFYVTQETASPPAGTLNGGVLQYDFSGKEPKLLYSQDGAVKRYTLATGKKIVAWVGYFHLIHYFSGCITDNTGWLRTFIQNDTSVLYSQYLSEFPVAQLIPAKYANYYHALITEDGRYSFEIGEFAMKHWLVSSVRTLVTEVQLPQKFDMAIPSPSNHHLLFGTPRQIYVYHIGSQIITDSLNLAFNYSTLAVLPNSTTVVLGSDSGYARLVTLPFSIPNIRDDFRADKTKMYVDSTIIFSAISGKTLGRYQWDFGDGATDTAVAVTHQYTEPGNYTVRLILTDTSGVIDTITKKNYITILPHLIPAFSATPRFGEAPLEVQFNDESKGAITSWKWSFGDGKTDSISNPQHIYSGKRYYNISLTISDGLSTKTNTISALVNTDTIPTNPILLEKKWVDQSKNYSYWCGKDVKNINNTFTRCLAGKDRILYLKFRGCASNEKWNNGRTESYYQPFQVIQFLDITQGNFGTNYTLDLPQSHSSEGQCSSTYSIEANQLISYRNKEYVTSFVGWSYPAERVTLPTLYFSSGRTFAPSGWTHDFDGAFQPDGTDIFLFRKGNTSSLQFFRQDSVLIARDSLIGDVMRPFASADSQSVTVIANPYIGVGDSSRWIVQRTYANNGQLQNEKLIEKSRYIRLYDAASIGWGEFLISGVATYTDTSGTKVMHAYLGKIGSDGRLAWEYFTPTWQRFSKLQRLSSGHYAAWGIPYNGFSHGFTAFRTDGAILADNRLTGASSSFSPSDFVVGKGRDELWFIGSENIPDQGQRAAVYLCHNPMSAITGVEEVPSTFARTIAAELFPLPAMDEITVRVTVPHEGRLRLSLVSAIGVEQFLTERDVNVPENTFRISTEGLPAGVYGIQIRLGEEGITLPAIILR